MDSQPKGTMASHLEHSAQAKTALEVSSLPPKGEEFVESYTPEETKKLLRKIDLRVIPILAILYFLSFLDRGILSIKLFMDQVLIPSRKYRKCQYPRAFGRLEFSGKPV